MLESTKALIEQQKQLAERYPDEEVSRIPADGDYDHRLVRESLFGAIVCTRKTVEEAAAWLTEVRPPGTSHNAWVPADPPDIEPCIDRPESHRHVVVEC